MEEIARNLLKEGVREFMHVSAPAKFELESREYSKSRVAQMIKIAKRITLALRLASRQAGRDGRKPGLQNVKNALCRILVAKNIMRAANVLVMLKNDTNT